MILPIAMLLSQAAFFSDAVPVVVSQPTARIMTIVPVSGLLANLPDTSLVFTPKSSKTEAVPEVPSKAEPSTKKTASTPENGEVAPNGLNAEVLGSPEDPRALSLIRIGQQSDKSRFVGIRKDSSRRAWIALAIAAHGAATFDAYSTRMSLERGNVERDPLMKPFASSGAIYAAIQASPVAFDYLARKMQRSQNSFLHRAWWIPQTASAVMSFSAGIHNMRMASRQ